MKSSISLYTWYSRKKKGPKIKMGNTTYIHNPHPLSMYQSKEQILSLNESDAVKIIASFNIRFFSTVFRNIYSTQFYKCKVVGSLFPLLHAQLL